MHRGRLIDSARALLGFTLLFWGINLLTPIIEVPLYADQANTLFSAIQDSGYLIETIAVLQLAAGFCLVANRLVSVALLVITPLSINVFLFYAVLDPSGLGGGLILLILNGVLIYENRIYYISLWKGKPPIITKEDFLSQLINQK